MCQCTGETSPVNRVFSVAYIYPAEESIGMQHLPTSVTPMQSKRQQTSSSQTGVYLIMRVEPIEPLNPCPCGFEAATEPWVIRQPNLELRFLEDRAILARYWPEYFARRYCQGGKSAAEEYARDHFVEHIFEEHSCQELGDPEDDHRYIPSHDEKKWRLRVEQLFCTWEASTPHRMWAVQVENECERLEKDYSETTGEKSRRVPAEQKSRIEDEAKAIVKGLWVEDCIWCEGWDNEPPPGSKWRHETSTDFEPSRPRVLFLRQVTKRMNSAPSFLKQVSPPIGEIHSQYCKEVMEEWQKRGIWDTRWEEIPGNCWRHEEPLQEFVSRNLALSSEPVGYEEAVNIGHSNSYFWFMFDMYGERPKSFYNGLPPFIKREQNKMPGEFCDLSLD